MVKTIAAEGISLYQLEQQFGLQLAVEPDFFSEWQGALPALTEMEQQRLERVKATFANLSRRSLLGNTLKLAIVGPLLDLAGLFLPPFYVTTEAEVEIALPEQNLMLRGRMDVLVLIEQVWVLVIESKRAELSVKVGIPQILAYMLSHPQPTQPLYGLVTNGSNFVFLKLVHRERPYYARLQEFVLENPNNLEQVLQILKELAERVSNRRN